MKPWVPQKYRDLRKIKIQESMEKFGHPAFSTVCIVENASFSFGTDQFFAELDKWVAFVPDQYRARALALVKETNRKLNPYWISDDDKVLFANVLLDKVYKWRVSARKNTLQKRTKASLPA